MNVLVLGANGMAGHMIAVLLEESGWNVTRFVRSKKMDKPNTIIGNALNFEELKKIIQTNHFDGVINAIGILNNAAENNHPEAILLNAYLPHYLTEITKSLKTKIIHISTDCVFSGDRGDYIETDIKDGTSFYDRSKALGEIDNSKDLTIRTSIIGPDLNKKGIGLFNWFMQQENSIEGYKEVYWSGVTTYHLAKAIKNTLNNDISGIYHLVNNDKINKLNLLKLFNQTFKKNPINITENTHQKSDKSLRNTRKEILLNVPSYKEMMSELKGWIELHKDLYPHYNSEEFI